MESLHLLFSSLKAVSKPGPSVADLCALHQAESLIGSMKSEIVRQACILVGGKGTRLGHLTRSVPKPLIHVAENTAFLDVVIDQVARQGFDDIVLLAGHLGHLVQERYDRQRRGSAHVRVMIERQPSGTAGALAAAEEIIAPQFLLLNGDTYADINLRALSSEDMTSDLDGVIALQTIADPSRYGTVVLEQDRVVRFLEKGQEREPALINIGAYVMRRSIVNRVRSLPCSLETDILPSLARERRLKGRVCEGYFIDIGVPQSLEQARRELLPLTRRRVAFLGLDYLICTDRGRDCQSRQQVEWMRGAPESIRRLNDLGYRVIVVGNLPRRGQRCLDEQGVDALREWMQDQLATQGSFIDAFQYYTQESEASIKTGRGHFGQKLDPGMIFDGFKDSSIRCSGSFMLSDKQIDIEVARRMGIPGYVFRGGDLAVFLEKCLAELA
jgi:dTDP-glucose pyrophosphorylase/histidinol phosphatase-like enzyme